MSKSIEIQREITSVINEDGEILSEMKEEKYRFNFKEAEPRYVKLYLDDISKLFNLTNSEMSVLLKSLDYVEYKTNIITLNKFFRNRIAKQTNLSDATIKNAISKLKKQGVYIWVDTGIYELNPNIFGFGTWKDIKGLRMTVEYTNKGKEIKTIEELKE